MSAFPLLRSVLVRATENPNKNMLDPAINLLMAFAAAASGVLIFATANSQLSEYQLLFGFCFAGGIGGGIVSVMLFPLDTLKKTAFKWIASSSAAGLFSPAIAQYLKVEQNVPYVLALSAAIGLFSWGVLLILVPLVGNKGLVWFLFKRWLKSWFNVDLQEIQKEEQTLENQACQKEREHHDWIEPVRKSKTTKEE